MGFSPIQLSRYPIVVDVTGLGRIQTLNIAECNMTLTCKATTNNNNAAPEGKFPLCLQPLIELTVHFFLNVYILHLQSVAFQFSLITTECMNTMNEKCYFVCSMKLNTCTMDHAV